MQKRVKWLLNVLLAVIVILSVMPEAAATEHVHDWQCQRADAIFHKMVCSGCGEENSAPHTLDDAGRCPTCGYEEHEHIWQEVVKIYDTTHHLRCAKCDTTTSQEHTFGSNGKCTTCGASPPHWHEWVSNGEEYGVSYHVLECSCGETKTEKHSYTWDRVTRTPQFHGIVCTVCGKTETTIFHGFNKFYFDGERCQFCGYETVPHTWEYANYFDEDSHMMYCPDYDTFASELHNPDGNGNCTVCGYHVSDVAKPETKPTEPDSPEDTLESQPSEPESTESEHTDVDSAETETDETEISDTESAESPPDETERSEESAVASKPISKNPAKEEPQRSGAVWVWVVVAVAVGGIGTAVVVLKRR